MQALLKDIESRMNGTLETLTREFAAVRRTYGMNG